MVAFLSGRGGVLIPKVTLPYICARSSVLGPLRKHFLSRDLFGRISFRESLFGHISLLGDLFNRSSVRGGPAPVPNVKLAYVHMCSFFCPWVSLDAFLVTSPLCSHFSSWGPFWSHFFLWGPGIPLAEAICASAVWAPEKHARVHLGVLKLSKRTILFVVKRLGLFGRVSSYAIMRKEDGHTSAGPEDLGGDTGKPKTLIFFGQNGPLFKNVHFAEAKRAFYMQESAKICPPRAPALQKFFFFFVFPFSSWPSLFTFRPAGQKAKTPKKTTTLPQH